MTANPPLAYFLTFRTYGTWHHGDDRGSVDRLHHNDYRAAPKISASINLVAKEKENQKGQTFLLDEKMRKVVHQAIREVCSHRSYLLHALNVRSNHGHAVVNGFAAPEKIVEAFKSYATRALRRENLVDAESKIWSRHASTRYLWKDTSVVAAIDYVLYCQGDDIPNF